jgi:hypothetical protein
LNDPKDNAQRDEDQDCHPDIGVNVGARDLVCGCRTRSFDAAIPLVHAVRKKQVEEDECRRQPVQDALRHGK